MFKYQNKLALCYKINVQYGRVLIGKENVSIIKGK